MCFQKIREGGGGVKKVTSSWGVVLIEMTLKIFNTRLMWPWVMKLLVDIYLDIWIRGLCKKVGHYS